MATLDTLQDAVNTLTSSTTTLVNEVQVKKATLDASVADAEAAQTAAAASASTASGHATSAAASAAAAASTASGLAGFDLDAIAATKAVTAVDVFVYDTSKDSDGGAWRKRTQHTSWYNETLNTATRGSRREFPAVAVIVAEAGKVTIYDGDDPALPMWMVFNRTNNSIWRYADHNATSIFAVNGIVVVGKYNAANYGGVALVRFVADDIQGHSNGRGDKSQGVYKGPILTRNDSLGWDTATLGLLVDARANDVAMTVLPDAPIDPATGLPVPTIAVATNGGVSVIKDDGTVVDSSSSGGFGSVEWQGDDLISWSYASRLVFPYSDWQADGFANPTERYSATSDIQLFRNATPARYAAVSATGNNEFSLGLISETGSDAGLFLVNRNNAQCHLTSTYNTGWMNGDIKGAFLSDTDDTDLVAATPLDDDFSTYADTAAMKTAGWSSATSTGTGDISLVSGAMQLDCDGVANRARGSRSFTTVVGAFYVVQYSSTSNHHFKVGTAENGTQNLSLLNQPTGANTFEYTFVATATTTYVTWEGFNPAGNEPQIDNISVQLADADRSVNNKNLIVNGTVTRTAVATGADLVAYSGFSSSNYLSQPYNADLDFGTGDFCVMGWVKTSGDGWVAETIDASNTEGFAAFVSGSKMYLRTRNGSNSQVLSSASVNTNTWTFFVGVRTASGTSMSMYINGVLDAAASVVARSIGGTDSPLRVALSNAGASAFPGSLALLRISATAPTAEQIKKIYEDEKVLFQEGAQATLAGTSDAVTSLAYDDVTQELLVGTSQNTSVFRGLRRVETISGSASAISASNGLRVIED